MKKIFYILASAIVALGAIACENEGLDNVNPEVKGEGLTITVNIDEATKVAFDGLTPSWEADDKLTIGTYEFTYTDNNTFTCEKEGVYSLCDGQKKEITAGTFDSSKGINGSAWWAQSVIEREGTEVTLELTTALLKVTAAADNTVLKSAMFSNEEDVALTKGVETYVPIWQGDGTTVTYSVNGIECKSLTKNFEGGKIYNLGTLEAPVFKVYVIAQPGTAYAKWEKVNLYTWVEGGVGLSWPGQDITANKETINDYTYNYFEYPAEYVGNTVKVIANNGTDQTEDIELGVLNTNYYVVYSPLIETQVTTIAPAAGSIEEYEAPANLDPKPETTTLYLKTTWGWSDWALYAWGGSGSWGSFNTWPGKAKEYDQIIEGVTYKAWDIPASCVGQTGTKVIVTGKEWGSTKQTKDTSVTFVEGKDVFVEITSWDSSDEKASMAVINGPY